MSEHKEAFWQGVVTSLDSGQLAAFVCDLQATVCWASTAFNKLASLGEQDKTGWSLVRIIAPEVLTTALHDILRSASGEHHAFQMTCVTEQGSRFDLFLLTFPARTPTGASGFGGIAIRQGDTESPQTGGDALFQRAMRQLPLPAALSDSEGRLLWANSSYYSATGASYLDLGQRIPYLSNRDGVSTSLDQLRGPLTLTDSKGRTVSVSCIDSGSRMRFWLHTIVMTDNQ